MSAPIFRKIAATAETASNQTARVAPGTKPFAMDGNIGIDSGASPD
jgi:hypothetical protein